MDTYQGILQAIQGNTPTRYEKDAVIQDLMFYYHVWPTVWTSSQLESFNNTALFVQWDNTRIIKFIKNRPRYRHALGRHPAFLWYVYLSLQLADLFYKKGEMPPLFEIFDELEELSDLLGIDRNATTIGFTDEEALEAETGTGRFRHSLETAEGRIQLWRSKIMASPALAVMGTALVHTIPEICMQGTSRYKRIHDETLSMLLKGLHEAKRFMPLLHRVAFLREHISETQSIDTMIKDVSLMRMFNEDVDRSKPSEDDEESMSEGEFRELVKQIIDASTAENVRKRIDDAVRWLKTHKNKEILGFNTRNAPKEAADFLKSLIGEDGLLTPFADAINKHPKVTVDNIGHAVDGLHIHKFLDRATQAFHPPPEPTKEESRPKAG